MAIPAGKVLAQSIDMRTIGLLANRYIGHFRTPEGSIIIGKGFSLLFTEFLDEFPDRRWQLDADAVMSSSNGNVQ